MNRAYFLFLIEPSADFLRLLMLFYAGMDWTSYRKAHQRILGAAVVAVSDLEVLATAFGEARRLSGLPSDHVFHAYDDAPAIQLTLMQSVLKSALTIRVGVVLYDSAEGIQDAVEHMSPADLTHDIGIRLMREFLPIYAVERLVADSELEGKKRETKFKKEIRALRSSGHFDHAPEIDFSVSRKSELIQAADLFVYNLYRSQRGVLEPEMERLIKAIRKDSNNVMIRL